MVQKNTPLTFSMPRDFTLTALGHVVNFKKDTPVSLPVMLHDHAIAAGAVPSGALPEKTAAASKAEPVDPELRKKAVFEAFKTIVARDERTDFNAGKKPHTHAIQAITGWSIDSRERDELWDAYRQSAE